MKIRATMEAISKWRSYNVCFSKAAFSISGLVFSHGFVEYAILSVLMYFIIDTEDDFLKAVGQKKVSSKLQPS
ncbi:hypothetical protein COLO4_13798 [Corchorus olitorius]|uniref:Uncharacterized protein n=1 Tax=Corchorus olitorius TaxID=93759 RepID=A0A1R3JV62_9ROSI|nr:hypothetical protein COLO4_13798 [Corchorus olitorius]